MRYRTRPHLAFWPGKIYPTSEMTRLWVLGAVSQKHKILRGKNRRTRGRKSHPRVSYLIKDQDLIFYRSFPPPLLRPCLICLSRRSPSFQSIDFNSLNKLLDSVERDQRAIHIYRPISRSSSSMADSDLHLPSIEVRNLSFKFPDGSSGLTDINLNVPSGSRTLLIGGKLAAG